MHGEQISRPEQHGETVLLAPVAETPLVGGGGEGVSSRFFGIIEWPACIVLKNKENLCKYTVESFSAIKEKLRIPPYREMYSTSVERFSRKKKIE